MELENTIISKRLQLLDNYKDFLNSTEKKINLFLDQIGWNAKDTFTEKKTSNRQNKIKTKINPNEPEILPDVWIPESSKSYIKLGMKDMNRIANKNPNSQKCEKIPQSIEQYQSTFTSEERLKIYEYVMQNTEFPKVSDVNLNFSLSNDASTTNDASSSKDELALKRDLKRRRAKYRKAASRGYKQELKDTIETQMEMYTNYLEKKYGIVNRAYKTDSRDGSSTMNDSYEYFTEETLKTYKDRDYDKSRAKTSKSKNEFNESDYFFHAHNKDHKSSSKRDTESHKDKYYQRNESSDKKSKKRTYSSDDGSEKSYKAKHKKKSKHKSKKSKHEKYSDSESDDKYRKKHKHKH